MPKYTTGTIAKMCGVTVRTVQYYDNQNIVKPSELTEGGRRLYSDEDYEKMLLVCSLKNLGLSLDTIKKIFKEENSKEVISMLFEEQLKTLRSQISEQEKQCDNIKRVLKRINSEKEFSVNSITDITFAMKNERLKKNYRAMLLFGIPADIIEIATILLWILKGIWIPFAVCMPIIIIIMIFVIRNYYKSAAYICPECHKVFKPTMKDFLFAAHTTKTRKLTCTECSYKGYCIVTDDESEK